MVPVDKVASVAHPPTFQAKAKSSAKTASLNQAPDAGDLKAVQTESIQTGSDPEPKPEAAVPEKVEKSEETNNYRELADLVHAAGLDMKSVRLEFDRDQNSGHVVIRVVDRETDETVREIPPEDLRRAQSVIQRLLDGNQEMRGVLIEIVT